MKQPAGAQATPVPKETPDRDAALEELLREARRLREVFGKAGFDARRFRRRFRQVLTTGSSVMEARGRLHRTDDAKDSFTDAERMACLGDGTVFPVHLLNALLAAKDPTRDEVLKELGTDKTRLREAAKRGVIVPRGRAAASTSKDKTRWN